MSQMTVSWDRNKILVGVARFEPVTPAFRTQCIFLQLLVFLDVAGDSATFCSRSFHPIRCGVLGENEVQRGSDSYRRLPKPTPHARAIGRGQGAAADAAR